MKRRAKGEGSVYQMADGGKGAFDPMPNVRRTTKRRRPRRSPQPVAAPSAREMSDGTQHEAPRQSQEPGYGRRARRSSICTGFAGQSRRSRSSLTRPSGASRCP